MYWWNDRVFLEALAVALLLIWSFALIAVYMTARKGTIKLQLNLLALAGAFLGFYSFMTGWFVVERGYDWSGSTTVSFFLLFSFPFTLVTPLAGFGNAAVLMYAIAFANEVGGVIEPMSAYLLGWASVAFLTASIVVPFGLKYDGQWRLPAGHRFLTLHFSRRKAERIDESS